jgi:hypothetical protein
MVPRASGLLAGQVLLSQSMAALRRASNQLQTNRVAAKRAACYIFVMTQTAKDILRRVETWPQEDQEELLEMVRAIEARRSGLYVLSEDERVAIEAARRSKVASDEKVRAFWERFGIA